MDDASFLTAEDAFRTNLRRRAQAPSRNNEFQQLDSALLSQEEGHALRRYLGGTRNSYDRSILEAARARLGPKDAA